EMAPDAQVYVASAHSASDIQAAVNYFAGQGVRILSRSLTAEYDGAGDGTGPIASVVSSAVSQGIAWFNSVGNSGGGNGTLGSYWRGGWSDPNANGILNFAPNDEAMGFFCGFINGLRWNDWGSNKTDYDAYVYDDPNLTVLESKSELDQSQPGVDPLEHLQCSDEGNAG